MRLQETVVAVLMLVSTSIYADDPTSVQQGASEYDWNICFDNKVDSCKLACSASDDIGCQSDCEDMAADKCRSEGLKPPEYD